MPLGGIKLFVDNDEGRSRDCHTAHLGECPTGIVEAAHRTDMEHAVKGVIREWEGVDVALDEMDA